MTFVEPPESPALSEAADSSATEPPPADPSDGELPNGQPPTAELPTEGVPPVELATQELAEQIAGEPAPALDRTLAAAVDLARAAAQEVAPGSVGEHVGVNPEAERVVTHEFVADLPGYRGWHWAVTVARVPRGKATVDEVVLLPGPDALLAPAWVPWQDRLQPGDLSPGDLLPAVENDPRLVPAYVDSGDPVVEAVAFELGLGRPHVMSREGRLDAAERWAEGDFGPDAPMARQAPAHCGTCGFYLPLEGSLRAGFGVCANEITASDGHVVSVEYGCGAHSEAGIDAPPLSEPAGEVFDDGEIYV